MVVTLSTDPPLCLPQAKTRIITAGTSGNIQRVKVTGAPPTSKFYRDDGTEVPLLTTKEFPERIGVETIVFEPDFPGEYTLVVEDISSLGERRPSYEGSTKAERNETILSRTLVTQWVCDKLTREIRVNQDAVTFVMWVEDDEVVSTASEVYGGDVGNTPRLENPTTARAKNAVENPDVLSVLGDMIGLDIDDVIHATQSTIDGTAQAMSQHFDSGTYHDNDGESEAVVDATAALESSPTTESGVVDAVNQLIAKYIAHIENYAIHDGKQDKRNTPSIRSASDIGSALIALSELVRVYNDHIASTAYHQEEDDSNDVGLTRKLHLLYVAILAAMVEADDPPTYDRSNEASTVMIAGAGFSSAFK